MTWRDATPRYTRATGSVAPCGGWPVRRSGWWALGESAALVVPRAQGLGLRVIAHDPMPDRDFAARHGVELCSLDDVFKNSDIVSLHSPATAETRDVVNRRTLGLMRRGAVLINTARGGLVDEDALAEALASGHLGGAGLDVFKVEPLPLTSSLLQFGNVIMAPHMGGLDEESGEAMSCLAAECLVKLGAANGPTAASSTSRFGRTSNGRA